MVLGVHGVHPQQTVGKQGGFLAAGTRTDFHDDAFFIVGIFGQKQQANFLFQVFQFFPVFA